MTDVDCVDCPETATALDTAEALMIVEPYFLADREVFLEAGFERLLDTKLYCERWVHDSPRHFAACRDDGMAILVAPEMAELDERMVLAILAHELGHAVDYLYPGEWVLGPERTVRRRRRSEFADDQWVRWIRSWEDRDADAVEIIADAIAEHVTGVPIGYSGPCLLQTFGRGLSRPVGLR